AVAVTHEDQVASSGEHATGSTRAAFGFPDNAAADGVPGLQPAVVGLLVVRFERGTIHLATKGNQRRRAFSRTYLWDHGGIVFPGRNVDQTGKRTEGVGMPGMATGSAGSDIEGFGFVTGAGYF